MALRASFLRVFHAMSTRKPGGILLGVGASAIGIGTAFGFSFVSAREKPKMVDLSKFMAEPLTEPDALENSMDDMKSRMEVMILGVQADICRRLAAIDGKEFRVDRWLRKEGGGGVSCVLQDGKECLEIRGCQHIARLTSRTFSSKPPSPPPPPPPPHGTGWEPGSVYMGGRRRGGWSTRREIKVS